MKTLVYCGAHAGESLGKLVTSFDRIEAIEAHPGLCEMLVKRFPYEHIHVHNIALAEESGGFKTFNVYGNDAGSGSLGKINPEAVDVVRAYWPADHFDLKGQFQVEAWKLSDWLEARKLSEVDFLVTDLQGYDATTLESVRELLEQGRIKKVQCEVDSDIPHYFDVPDNSIDRVLKLFQMPGWQQTQGPTGRWPVDANHLQADLVFEWRGV